MLFCFLSASAAFIMIYFCVDFWAYWNAQRRVVPAIAAGVLISIAILYFMNIGLILSEWFRTPGDKDLELCRSGQPSNDYARVSPDQNGYI
ncbi:hypothetical protein AB6A40_004119 [Gnathostoma spinigerum]|uniref:Uncharacterized protein n=1 Tax=Gnathostoma spinigerum TaxID=75299 RepID=A0ABD6ECP6_9BILA